MISAKHLGLEVVRVSAGEELVKCPFHKDNRPSAWFRTDRGLFWCSVCQKGMNTGQLVAALGLDLDLNELLSEYAWEIPDLDLVSESVDLPYGTPGFFPYMKARGIIQEVAQLYSLEYSVVSRSIVIPFFDMFGIRIGTVQRYISPEAAGMRYKKTGTMVPVWPLPFLANFKTRDTFIVTEGPWSAMRISTVSIKRGARGIAFSLFGAKANQEIVDVLSPFNPVFLYDNDTAGRNACRKMRSLAPHWNSYTLAKAPDDMNDVEIAELLEKVAGAVYG